MQLSSHSRVALESEIHSLNADNFAHGFFISYVKNTSDTTKIKNSFSGG